MTGPVEDAHDAEVKEWADLSYELWALVCNSIPFEPRFADEWTAQRDRLGARFHLALAKLHGDGPTNSPPEGT